jgi:hypothetical protein
MPRSQRILQSDLPQPDGMVSISAFQLSLLAGGGTGVLTRIASGEWSLRISTNTASVIATAITNVLRFGMADDFQERFGTGLPNGADGQAVGFPSTLSTGSALAGVNINIAVLSSVNFKAGSSIVIDTVASGVQEKTFISAIPDATHITVNSLASAHTTPFPLFSHVFATPAGISGSPPYTGVSQFAPVTVPRPKGIMLKQITPRYIINTANLAANTIGITQILYNNNVVAPAATTILANAANGLGTAFGANPYVTPIPIPVANQNFLINRNADIVIEWDVQNNGGTVDLLGIMLDVSFNYN